MKLSASVYSNKETPLKELVGQLDKLGVDMIHIDCNDEIKVFDDILEIKKTFPNVCIDLHIITPDARPYLEKLKNIEVDFVCFQYENLKEMPVWPSEIKAKKGIAVITQTNTNGLEENINDYDYILFMTTTPGQSGGTFNKENFKKIRKFRQQFPAKAIHVDGGVNAEIAFFLRNLGVDTIISGSYLVNANEMSQAVIALRRSSINSHLQLSEVMIGLDELPVLNITNSTFKSILETIDKFNLGFVLIVNELGELKGLVTNADVRKTLLKNINNLNTISLPQLINSNPAVVYETNTVNEMILKIKELPFSVLFMPIVDKQNILKGAITFNNLIKGEL